MSKPENPKLNEPKYFNSSGTIVQGSDITLRDLFAGMAMQKLIASGRQNLDHRMRGEESTKDMVARTSYSYADAMLAEREKEKP